MRLAAGRRRSTRSRPSTTTSTVVREGTGARALAHGARCARVAADTRWPAAAVLGRLRATLERAVRVQRCRCVVAAPPRRSAIAGRQPVEHASETAVHARAQRARSAQPPLTDGTGAPGARPCACAQSSAAGARRRRRRHARRVGATQAGQRRLSGGAQKWRAVATVPPGLMVVSTPTTASQHLQGPLLPRERSRIAYFRGRADLQRGPPAAARRIYLYACATRYAGVRRRLEREGWRTARRRRDSSRAARARSPSAAAARVRCRGEESALIEIDRGPARDAAAATPPYDGRARTVRASRRCRSTTSSTLLLRCRDILARGASVVRRGGGRRAAKGSCACSRCRGGCAEPRR